MKYIAFDLGASSGKLFSGEMKEGKLCLEQVHSFENSVVALGDDLYWDFLHIYSEVCRGLRRAEENGCVDSFGIDSYNNDFTLVDGNGEMLVPIRSYRDPRTKKHWEEIFSVMDERTVYMYSGNQIAPFNTLMQLAAMNLNGQHFLLENAHKLLMLPDMLGFCITGRQCIEYTLAAETELIDLGTKEWIDDILTAYDIPRRLLPSLAVPGSILGQSTHQFNTVNRLRGFDFVNVCEHDTASAFLASPYDREAVYISSGTWSLVGLENDAPVVNDFTYSANIANEGGMDGHHRLLKNVMGAWLLQELRKDYAASGTEYSYSDTQELALQAEPFRFIIDPDSEEFYLPGDMCRKIREVSLRNCGRAPETPGEFFRCVYESLAMKYRFCIELLEKAADRRCSLVSIFGGGCQDALLNRFTASACGKPVAAGPADASSVGNICVQMLAHGELKSIDDARALVRRSFTISEYGPENKQEWDVHYPAYASLFRRALNMTE